MLYPPEKDWTKKGMNVYVKTINNHQATKAAASLVNPVLDGDRPAYLSQPFKTPSALVKSQKMNRQIS